MVIFTVPIMESRSSPAAEPTTRAAQATVFPILIAISLSHMLNDTLQSVIPAIYPLVKDAFQLSFGQIGLITFTFQLTASLLQPAVGAFTDRRPQPFSLATGMTFTLAGLVLLSFASSYGLLLVSVALIGLGSSVFHPESSRVAHMAAGSRGDWPSRYSRWAATSGLRWARCLPQWCLPPEGRPASSGSRRLPWLGSRSWRG